MNECLTRIYKKIDIQEVKRQALIYGDLGGQCANCQTMDLKLDSTQCPMCKTEFRYISFRHIRNHLPKIEKIFFTRPKITIIDFDDYSHNTGIVKAREFLK